MSLMACKYSHAINNICFEEFLEKIYEEKDHNLSKTKIRPSHDLYENEKYTFYHLENNLLKVHYNFKIFKFKQ